MVFNAETTTTSVCVVLHQRPSLWKHDQTLQAGVEPQTGVGLGPSEAAEWTLDDHRTGFRTKHGQGVKQSDPHPPIPLCSVEV